MTRAFQSLKALEEAVVSCRRCPELRDYCAEVARTKRRAYADCTYWGRPVPAFGDRRARILLVGLAPGAHGANRTGRMFTGDRSGDFLYAALYRVGLCTQAESTARDDGLRLQGVYISAACRCAPPANRPTVDQLRNCAPYLEQEIELLRPAVILCLGGIAWSATLAALRELGADVGRPRPKFRHGGEVTVNETAVLGSYHVSQQNTFTGRLTEGMLDEVLERAKRLMANG